MTSFKCKECGADYKTRRSLHAHIKKHNMLIGDYYVKHFQRRDKFTGELLPFKKFDDYFKRDFSHRGNFAKWIKQTNKVDVCDYLVTLLNRRIREKGIDYGPCDLELKSAELPSVDTYKKFFGSYTEACAKCGVKPLLRGQLPKAFWGNYSHEMIMVDTREQKPLTFSNSASMKLDVGDYSTLPEKFDYTFVDRKSLADFCASVTNAKERFKREMERCREMGSYLFVVVEADYEKLRFENRKLFHKHHLRYVMANMREFQKEFSDCCQFVFSGNREYSTLLIPKLLCLGRKTHNVDIQYFWEKHLKQREEAHNGMGSGRSS